MDPIVSESDIVYTFLHCLMRDEQDLRTMKEGTIAPHILLSFQIHIHVLMLCRKFKLIPT